MIALLVHGALGATTVLAPVKKMEERIVMDVVRAPPPPKPPEPPPPPPPPPPKEKPPPPPPPPPVKEPPPPPPPPPNQTPPPDPPKEPVPLVTGISMSSTVEGNSGFNVRVGNTTYGDPNKEKFVNPQQVKPYAGGSKEFKAVRQSQVTTEARVLKDYKGVYPKELADRGVEGAVQALVDISSTGEILDVRLAKSCGNATLDKLALEYIKRFRFEPAHRGNEPVDYTLRYTYRFEVVN
ncbi:MAG TPA: TonB family protein [Myxococcota bacterium]